MTIPVGKCSYCQKEKVIALVAGDRDVCEDCLKKLLDYLFRLHLGMSPDKKPINRGDK